MRYRKIPIEVQAFRLGFDAEPQWFIDKINSNEIDVWVEKRLNGRMYCYIKTFEGTLQSNKGDYIIQKSNGKIYPCKQDKFEQMYEAVNRG